MLVLFLPIVLVNSLPPPPPLLISSQIHFVRRILALPPPHRNLRDKQRCFYERKFQEIFPSASIHLFGSSVNGFGVKGCDMDVYLNIPELQGCKNHDKVHFHPPTQICVWCDKGEFLLLGNMVWTTPRYSYLDEVTQYILSFRIDYVQYH